MSKEMSPHEINVRTIIRTIAMLLQSGVFDEEFATKAGQWMQQMPEDKSGYHLKDKQPPKTAA